MQHRAAHLDRAAAKLSAKATQLQQMSEWLAAFDVWTRPEPGARQTRLTRDDIAAAALRIVDAEGFDALSMRRLASELDVGTMSLYHYIHNKDELLLLLSDAVMGEIVVPEDEFTGDWRARLLAIAERTRATLMRHPWILELPDETPPGPNSVRHYDQSMQAVAGLEVSLAEQADLVATVDEYVFGYCMHARQPEPNPVAAERLLEHFSRMIDSGRFPALAKIRDRYGTGPSFAEIGRARTDPARFERNLNRLLDGFGY